MKVLVTGGCGFIGSNFVRYLLGNTTHQLVNVDKLTYAANPLSLKDIDSSDRYSFHQCDIVDAESLANVFRDEQPDAIVHLAAESHVDRSISAPADFIQSNVVGTFNLLNCAMESFLETDGEKREQFRFVHVSTDEVYGSLQSDSPTTTEGEVYAPSSPYSASKAGSDHLVRAWNVTYGLPTVITHAANNYGPYQYPEKFIPTIIANAVNRKSIPVYGDGNNVRDWLHVEDHCAALAAVLKSSTPGETYNIGANNEQNNNEVAHQVCCVLDKLLDRSELPGDSHSSLIQFVTDRKGHDFRYALNTEKIQTLLGWKPEHSWEQGIQDTVRWYIENRSWWQAVENQATANVE